MRPLIAPRSVAFPFDAAMRRWMTTHTVPRASVAVMRDGRLVFVSGYDGRNANERVPVWSLSKAITALCIASLIKEKRLGLGDPIGRPLAPFSRSAAIRWTNASDVSQSLNC
jgi:CubicO group peptidase (beta-lactamase class C family)